MARSWIYRCFHAPPPPSLAFVCLHLANRLWNPPSLCAGMCLNLWVWSSQTERVPTLRVGYEITTCHTSLVARSPDPIDSWLTFSIKANRTISAVMFYFHLNKGHKESRHSRALPPLPLLPHPIIGVFQRADKCHWLDWGSAPGWFEWSDCWRYRLLMVGGECASWLPLRVKPYMRTFCAASWWMLTCLHYAPVCAASIHLYCHH